MEQMPYWIVVVDDEELSLKNTKNMLGEENMRVSCMRSGKDLLKFIEKNTKTPDLILLDIMMPDMNGFDTFSALRELEDHEGKPHIPVIFLTGENDNASEKQGLELGASDYVRKPFNKEVIVKRIENIIKNSKTIENLTEEAMFDMLTGFLNKSRGTERISKLCNRKTGALMIMDLDNFKLVNDLFGHDMGDKILVAFSDIIRNNIRETDTISRIGGDEFMAFYEDITEESAIASITLRLNSQLQDASARLMGDDHGIPLGISIGVVMIPGQGRDYDELFAKADSALYIVKQNGKHGYSLYDQSEDGSGAPDITPEQKLERIMKIIRERNDLDGALMLGSNSFALIYRFVMRFYKRYGGSAALVLFSLDYDGEVNNLNLLETCSSFSNILQKNLRSSDIIMQSGSSDFFVMLTEQTRSEAESATDRIMQEWEETDHKEDVKVGYVIKYIDHIGESME